MRTMSNVKVEVDGDLRWERATVSLSGSELSVSVREAGSATLVPVASFSGAREAHRTSRGQRTYETDAGTVVVTPKGGCGCRGR